MTSTVARATLAACAVLICQNHLQSHPADISHLRVRLEPHRVELRLTMNVLTLLRFHTLDADGDGRMSKTELHAAERSLREHLLRGITVAVNGQDDPALIAGPMECLWPEERPDAPPPDPAGHHVDFTFTHQSTALIGDVWLEFDWFASLGQQHTVQARYECADQPAHEIIFTAEEPHYMYDTGLREATPPATPAPATQPPADRQGIVIILSLAALLALARIVVWWWAASSRGP